MPLLSVLEIRSPLASYWYVVSPTWVYSSRSLAGVLRGRAVVDDGHAIAVGVVLVGDRLAVGRLHRDELAVGVVAVRERAG